MADNKDHKDEKDEKSEAESTDEEVVAEDGEELALDDSASKEESDAPSDASDESEDDVSAKDDDEPEASDDEEGDVDSDDEPEASDDDDEDEDSDDEDEDSDDEDSDDEDSDDEDSDDEDSDDVDSDDEPEASDDEDDRDEEEDDDEDEELAADADGGDDDDDDDDEAGDGDVLGIAAFFDLPDDLMLAAAHTRDSKWDNFDAFSPFPIHGMDDAMGLGRSWIPWVTFGAGSAGLMTAIALQFGTMTFDWPMIIGGKPYAPWPSFVPVMFELTVLMAGCISALVMLIAAGCFKKPLIIDPELTQDRFALWISADDEEFDLAAIKEFMETLDPVEIRTITAEA